MSMDLTKLSPGTWEVLRIKNRGDSRCFSVAGAGMLVEHPDVDAVDTHPLARLLHGKVVRDTVCSDLREWDAEFIALARNAFDVMMRRGWTNVVRVLSNGKTMWCVNLAPDGKLTDQQYHMWHVGALGLLFDDPFTAVVEADKWYKENIERTTDYTEAK